MGNLRDQQNKPSDAEKMYRRAIEFEPNNAYAHYNLGLLLSEIGKKDEADAELAKAVKIDSDFKE
ncbi:MAG: tetratricopeptide repeat protein [Cyclobacteriaceae bacterium]